MKQEITINLENAIERGLLEKRTVKPIGHLIPEQVTYGQIAPELFGRGVSLTLTIKPDGTKKYWYLFTRFAQNDRCMMAHNWLTDFEVRRATWGEVWDEQGADERDKDLYRQMNEEFGTVTNDSPGYMIKQTSKHGQVGEKYQTTYHIVFIADEWSKGAEPIRFKEAGIYCPR